MNRDKPNELGFAGGATVRIQNKLPLGMALQPATRSMMHEGVSVRDNKIHPGRMGHYPH